LNADRIQGSVTRCLGHDHPVAEGHFPGNPIIPGALLLDCALRAITEALPSDIGLPLKLRNVKFLHPLRPEEPFEIRYWQQDDEVAFECSRAADRIVIMTGAVRPGDQ